MMEEFQIVLLSKVVESSTNPRRSFRGMEELTESVRKHGVLVPLLVRPVNGHLDAQSKNSMAIRGTAAPDFEIIAGARRYRAAKSAGIPEIPVRVKDIGETEALELQICENLQREDVHPLEEAIGYRALMDRAGYDVPAVAAKVGKSESYVYQRLKLSDLIKPAQKLFLEDRLNAGHAILIARLQPKDQEKALEACFENYERDGDGKPPAVSVRDLNRWIQHNIHLDLHAAPFKKDDPDLVAGAGPCTTCPKRTGFVPALFPDIAHKDTCTDRVCYEGKLQAFIARKQAELEAKGEKVLRISSEYSHSLRSPEEKKLVSRDKYVEVTKKDRCGSEQKALVVHGYDHRGKVMEVCADPECKKHHGDGERYHRPQAEIDKQRRAEEKRRMETEIRRQILEGILAAAPTALDPEDWRLVACSLTREMQNDDAKFVCKRHGWEPVKGQWNQRDFRKAIADQVRQLNGGGLMSLLVELSLARYATVSPWGDSKPVELLETAKRYKVNADKIRKTVTAAFEEKMKSKKAKGKKAAAGADKTEKNRTKPTKAAKNRSAQPVCERCRCTEDHACPGGCSWSIDFLAQKRRVCTKCEEAVRASDLRFK
jgi:ParB family chromosome partitioning protein